MKTIEEADTSHYTTTARAELLSEERERERGRESRESLSLLNS